MSWNLSRLVFLDSILLYMPPSSFLSFSLKETPSTLGSLFKKFFFGYVCEQLSYLSLFSFFFLVMFSFSLPYIPSKKYFNIKCPSFFFFFHCFFNNRFEHSTLFAGRV